MGHSNSLNQYIVEMNEYKTNLEHHSRLFQKVRPHVGSYDVLLSVKSNLNVLPKATTVVVSRRLGISYSLHADENLDMTPFLGIDLFDVKVRCLTAVIPP